MANINKTPNKNVVEIIRDLNNVKLERIVINGVPVAFMGFSDDAGREEAIRAIQKVVDNSNDIFEIIEKLSEIATLNEKNIRPDEEIEVRGKKYFISYSERIIYGVDGEEIVNMNDLKDVPLPDTAVKTILIDRLKARK